LPGAPNNCPFPVTKWVYAAHNTTLDDERKVPRMKRMLAVAALFCGLAAHADDAASPIGSWKTIDDHDGSVRAVVEVYAVGDELQGKIVQTFPRPGQEPKTVCDKCSGERKNQPIIGMVFLWDLKRDGDVWRHGEILDPDNGTVYDAKIKLVDGGQKLEVRGFLGLSLLGRTQTWLRQ
jgi:uncharacterized protein (DUF2147 family)